MIKKLNLIFLMLLFLINIGTYAQMKRCIVGNISVNVTGETPVIDPLPNFIGHPNNFATNENGSVIFYYSGGNLYDGKSSLIKTVSTVFTSCIEDNTAVIPFFSNRSSDCIDQYYLLYNAIDNVSGNYKIYALVITANAITGQVTADDILDGSGNKKAFIESNYMEPAFAVACDRLFYTRHTYCLTPEGMYRITMDYNDILADAVNIFRPVDHPDYEFETSELDISPDGVRLAWGMNANHPRVDKQNRYYIIGLDDDGNYAPASSYNETFFINNTGDYTRGERKVEFHPLSNKLYFSTPLGSGGGIFVRDLVTKTNTFIPGTELYAESDMETGYDFNIYTVSLNNQLATIDPATNTFPNKLITINPSFNGGVCNPTGTNREIPDQIRGDTYEEFRSEYYDAYNYTVSAANPLWRETSNPFHAQDIMVSGYLKFTNPGTYEINRMNIKFSPDAYIEIGNGVTLKMSAVTLSANDCTDKLWKGIIVKGNGQLLLEYDDTEHPFGHVKIYDAKTAIYAEGPDAVVNVAGTIFNRNQTHVKLLNISPGNCSFSQCNFFHTEALRNGSVTPQYGTIGLDLGAHEDSTSIDTVLVGTCSFEGGIYAIKSHRVPVDVYHSAFSNISNPNGIAVWANMDGFNGKVTIDDSWISNVPQALRAERKSSVSFTRNEVYNTKQHSVFVSNCNNRRIDISDNTFDNCPVSAIMLSNNSGTTYISISRNTINNTSFYYGLVTLANYDKPTGISVMELGLPYRVAFGMNTFDHLQIDYNSITNTAFGIKIANVAGYQLQDVPYNPSPSVPKSDINNNTIAFIATYKASIPTASDWNNGILLTRCSGMRVVYNNVLVGGNLLTTLNTRWRNAGIYSDQTNSSLFYKNSVFAGRGIAGIGEAMGNDYLCNTFNQNVNGISLEDHYMRKSGTVHGRWIVESRDNSYSGSLISDIELYTRTASLSTLLTLASQNRWLMSANPSVELTPKPTTGTPLSYIKAGIAPNICNFPRENWPGTGTIRDLPDLELKATQPLLYWNNLYEYERQQKVIEEVNDQFMSQLIDLEELVITEQNDEALGLLSSMSSPDIYGQHFITVYQIILDQRINNDAPLSASDINTLTGIAAKTVEDNGPAIFLARSILWTQLGMNFNDMENNPSGEGIVLHVIYQPCYPALPAGLLLGLKDNTGVIHNIPITVDATGLAYIAPQYLTSLPTDRTYTFISNISHVPAEYLPLSTWLNMDYNQLTLTCTGTASRVSGTQNFSGDLKLYPNPVQDNLTIELDNDSQEDINYTVEVFDVLGKKVFESKVSNEVNQLSVSCKDWSNGIYLVKITDHKGEARIEKIAVEK